MEGESEGSDWWVRKVKMKGKKVRPVNGGKLYIEEGEAYVTVCREIMC